MPPLASRTIDRVARLVGLHHLGRRAQRRRLLVVCYHGLRDDDDPTRHWLLLPRSSFERQIAYLAAHYQCLPIDEALDRLWRGRLTEPTACVTFDDGYRNNLTIGLPVLRAHGVPATVYLATALIGTPTLLWTTALELAFRRSRATSVDLGVLGIGEARLDDASARARAAKRAIERLKTMPSVARRSVERELHDRLAADGTVDDGARVDDFALLSWDEVRALGASRLVTFGGHTAHHEIVSRLDDGTLDEEIGGSVAAVRREVPSAVSNTFAYPNGRPQDVDARAAAAAARAGCAAAVTTTEGLNDADTPRMYLRRAVIGSDATMDGFAAQTAALRSLVGR